MDSLTQLVVGGVLAAAVVPAKHRRAALAAGAALGTLPDLDVLPLNLLNDDPVLKMTAHRSITHSLLILPWLATLIWWWYRRQGGRVAQAPKHWWWAMFLALITHPLLDCFNAYGTWLFWPFGEQAVMWGNMFVIDPAFTLPLLFAFVFLAIKPEHGWTASFMRGAIAVSLVYFAWSLAAQMWVMQKVDKQLQALGLQDAEYLVSATPFNTLLWQVIVKTPNGIISGDYSLLQDRDNQSIAWQSIASDTVALAHNQHNISLQRLQRFNQGFYIATVQNEQLIISDVRMGRFPNYTFNFTIASLQDGSWQEINPPVQIQNRANIKVEWEYLKTRILGD